MSKKKEQKATRKQSRRLNRLEKANRREEQEFQIRHETRLDTLEGLLSQVSAGITLDAPALIEMIHEVKRATTPVSAISEPGEVSA